MAESWLQGIQLGANIASEALARSDRLQQMRSQEALRRVQERQMAQETELLMERVEQLKAANALQKRYQADMESARESYLFDVDTFSKLAVANGMVPDASAIHDIAVQRNIEPVLDLYHPEKSSQIRADRARMRDYELRSKLVGQPRPKTPEETALINARTETEKEKLAQIKEGGGLPTSQMKNASRIAQLETQIPTLPDGAEKAKLQKELFSLQEQTSPSGTTIFDPVTGKPLAQIGGKKSGDGPSAGLQSDVTAKVTAQKRLVEGLQELLSSGEDKYFGPGQKIANVFYDKLFSNVAPETANPERIQSFQKNQELRNSAIRALTDDKGQLSEGDVKRIKQLFPDDGIFNGSPAEARALWGGLIRSAKGNARRLGESIGKAQLWAYEDIELQNLRSIFPDLTREELLAEIKRRGIRAVQK